MIDYTCVRCRKKVTKWEAKVTEEGKIVLTGRCHGDSVEFTLAPDMRGIVFYKGNLGRYPDRDPVLWRDPNYKPTFPAI